MVEVLSFIFITYAASLISRIYFQESLLKKDTSEKETIAERPEKYLSREMLLLTLLRERNGFGRDGEFVVRMSARYQRILDRENEQIKIYQHLIAVNQRSALLLFRPGQKPWTCFYFL